MLYEMKQGNPAALRGEVIAYAKIKKPDAPENSASPVYEVAKSGIIAAHGDYRSHHSLSDFLRSELGISLNALTKDKPLTGLPPESLSQEGIPEGLDIDILKKKMESIKGFEEMIPTPAKLEPFENEQEILSRSCDIYYLGEFDRLANANLAVNAVPILYQAVFREQQLSLVEREIEKLISGTESAMLDDNYAKNISVVEQRLNGEFISELLYNSSNLEERKKWEEKLRNYMWGYRFPTEVDKIILLASKFTISPDAVKKLLEMHVKKIAAFLKEDYKTVGALKKGIEEVEKETPSLYT